MGKTPIAGVIRCFHSSIPSDVPDREIDFIMLRPTEAFEVIEHRVVDEGVASDHRPLLAVLRLW